jgi:hypothetical protein
MALERRQEVDCLGEGDEEERTCSFVWWGVCELCFVFARAEQLDCSGLHIDVGGEFFYVGKVEMLGWGKGSSRSRLFQNLIPFWGVTWGKREDLELKGVEGEG